MSKQMTLFPNSAVEIDTKYSKKIEAPVYEPRHAKPHASALCDDRKTQELIRQIDASSLPEIEKQFLLKAATRHCVFHYERIADYYAHATPEMQRLMEESALVIIDFEAAIERGFVSLCDEIRRQYLEEYNADVT